MIVELSIRGLPLAGLLRADDAFVAVLRDLDVVLVFTYVRHQPRPDADRRIEPLRIELDHSLVDRIRQRRAYVVIDHSNEGYNHREHFSEAVHDWCASLDIPPSSVLYVNQNRTMARQYADWCDERAIHDRYHVIGFDAWVHRTAEAVRMLDWPSMEDGLLHRRRRAHRFLNLNNAPRPERIIVASHLLAVSPPDALVSLGADKESAARGKFVTPEASLQRIRQKYGRRDLAEAGLGLPDDFDLDALRSRTTLPSPELVDIATPMRFDPQLYAESYVSVVTETDMSNGTNTRITEKSIKPFLFGHLAIVAGNPGALATLRGLGFETFSSLIDESYDEIAVPARRLAAVLAQVDRLRALDGADMAARFVELEDVRRANLRHGRDVLADRLAADVRSALERVIVDDRRAHLGDG